MIGAGAKILAAPSRRADDQILSQLALSPSPIQFEGRPFKRRPYDVKTGHAAHGAGDVHLSRAAGVLLAFGARRQSRLTRWLGARQPSVSCLPGAPKGGTIRPKSMGDRGNAGHRRSSQI
jgi:hypothetical protein